MPSHSEVRYEKTTQIQIDRHRTRPMRGPVLSMLWDSGSSAKWEHLGSCAKSPRMVKVLGVPVLTLHYLSEVECMDSGFTTAERGQAFPLKLATWSDEIAVALGNSACWLAGWYICSAYRLQQTQRTPRPPMAARIFDRHAIDSFPSDRVNHSTGG